MSPGVPHLSFPHHAQELQECLLVCWGHCLLRTLSFAGCLRFRSLDISCRAEHTSQHCTLISHLGYALLQKKSRL